MFHVVQQHGRCCKKQIICLKLQPSPPETLPAKVQVVSISDTCSRPSVGAICSPWGTLWGAFQTHRPNLPQAVLYKDIAILLTLTSTKRLSDLCALLVHHPNCMLAGGPRTLFYPVPHWGWWCGLAHWVCEGISQAYNAGGVSQSKLLHKYEVPNCHILAEGALSVWNFSFGVVGSYTDHNGQW